MITPQITVVNVQNTGININIFTRSSGKYCTVAGKRTVSLEYFCLDHPLGKFSVRKHDCGSSNYLTSGAIRILDLNLIRTAGD